MKAFFLLVLLGVAYCTYNNAPFIMWSGESALNGQMSTLTASVSSEQIANSFQHFLQIKSVESTSPLSSYLANYSPELLVLFVADNMNSDSFIRACGAHGEPSYFSNLKNAISNSKSSILAPYSNNVALQDSLVNIISQTKGKVFLSQEFVSRYASQFEQFSVENSNLESILANKDNEIYHNGVTDLVIVDLSSYTKSDQVIGRFVQNIEAATSSYVSSFFSLMQTPIEVVKNNTGKRQTGTTDTSSTSSTSTSTSSTSSTPIPSGTPVPTPAPTPGPTPTPNPSLSYLPSAVIEGMIIGFIILLIFFSGACCLLQVQTPERFDLGKNIVSGN